MPSQAPGEYETLAGQAFGWVVDRLETSHSLTWDSAAALASSAMYALRAAPMVRYYMTPAQNAQQHRSLFLDQWRPGDEIVVHAMIARHEGQESLQWFRFWQQRAPNGVLVLRNAQEQPVACMLRLDMEALDPQARAADPMTCKLWQALQTRFTMHPGDHIPFVRHWVTRDYTVSDSPEKTRLLMAIHVHNVTAKNLRLSAQVFDETGNWERPAAALGINRLGDSDTTIGDKNWRIYYNDWALEPPTHYYRRLADRVLSCKLDAAGQPVTTATDTNQVAFDGLDEAAFRRAVVDALKHFHQAGKLRHNALLHCALVTAAANDNADDETRLQGLCQIVETAVETMANSGGQGHGPARMLQVGDLQPCASQKAAAATLHMGYSTFRRHMGRAREALAGKLWLLEMEQRKSVPATDRLHTAKKAIISIVAVILSVGFASIADVADEVLEERDRHHASVVTLSQDILPGPFASHGNAIRFS